MPSIFFFFDELGDFTEQVGFIDLVGEFVYDDGLFAVAVVGLDMGFGADVDAAASGFVGFADALGAVYQRAGGEIRPRQVAHQRAGVGFGVVKQVQAGVECFAEVVRRDVGRHANRDWGCVLAVRLALAGCRRSSARNRRFLFRCR